MTLEACIRKMDSSILGAAKTLILNFEEQADYLVAREHLLAVKQAQVILSTDCCFHHADEIPDTSVVFDRLSGIQSPVVLFDIANALRLESDDATRNFLTQLLAHTYAYSVIVVCYRCESCIPSTSPRERDRVISIGQSHTVLPKLYFIPEQMNIPSNGHNILTGVDQIATHMTLHDARMILIHTKKQKKDYPDSSFWIVDVASSFDLLCLTDEQAGQLDQSYGSVAQWDQLLQDVKDTGSIENVIRHTLGAPETYELQFATWHSLSSYDRLLLYIGLKLFATLNSQYLEDAICASSSPDMLAHTLYFNILTLEPQDRAYPNVYTERKRLLCSCGESIQDVSAFIKFTNSSKEQNAIWYYTDCTQPEREAIIKHLGQFQMAEDEVRTALQLVYPDLFEYLQPYHFNNPLLDRYFQLYSFCKVTNRICPEMEKLVAEQAIAREYNTILPSRSDVVDEIGSKQDAHLYFVDAMGVEFLSYILYCCRLEKLTARIRLAHGFLPSITTCNKEFLQVFERTGAKISPDIKELDEIKHHGKQDFLYTKDKNPLHLIEEMHIVRKLIKVVATNLATESHHKAVLIADHGASRLAVIREMDEPIDSNEKGTHGGRIRKADGIHDDIPNAVKTEDGWIVLADYHLFKGGRAANVETHGGATLEEVTVPIIEITLAKEITITMLDEKGNLSPAPTITFSFKKPAVLRFYASEALADVMIRIGKTDYMVKAKNENLYELALPREAHMKAGKHSASVFSGGNLMQADLPFTLEKESGNINQMGL